MGAFEYTALDAQGKERKGLIEGDTAKHVRQLLREKQLLPMEIQEAAQSELKRSRAKRFMRRGLSTLDLALLTRQLATLLRSGLPLEESLQAVAEQTEKPRVQRIILGVRSKVVEGHPLADGLRDFPRRSRRSTGRPSRPASNRGGSTRCSSACRISPNRGR
jgi:general secretion pathway protein F